MHRSWSLRQETQSSGFLHRAWAWSNMLPLGLNPMNQKDYYKSKGRGWRSVVRLDLWVSAKNLGSGPSI